MGSKDAMHGSGSRQGESSQGSRLRWFAVLLMPMVSMVWLALAVDGAALGTGVGDDTLIRSTNALLMAPPATGGVDEYSVEQASAVNDATDAARADVEAVLDKLEDCTELVRTGTLAEGHAPDDVSCGEGKDRNPTAWARPDGRYNSSTSSDITDMHGWRKAYGRVDYHSGIDIGLPAYAPVYAVADGEIVQRDACGTMLKIGTGHLVAYWHIEPHVGVGDALVRGQQLGKTRPNAGCNSGFSPHLDLKVYPPESVDAILAGAEGDDHSINPLPMLCGAEGVSETTYNLRGHRTIADASDPAYDNPENNVNFCSDHHGGMGAGVRQDCKTNFWDGNPG